jgi:hypothetical protein
LIFFGWDLAKGIPSRSNVSALPSSKIAVMNVSPLPFFAIAKSMIGADAGFDSQMMGKEGRFSGDMAGLSPVSVLSSGLEQLESKNVARNTIEITPIVLTKFDLDCSHTRSFI